MARKSWSKREYIDPVQYLKMYSIHLPPHVTFDASLVPDYRIRRGQAHDGTHLFTYELINTPLHLILNRLSYYKRTKPEWWEGGPGVRYIIGMMRLATVFPEKVDLPIGRYASQRERVALPVRCLWHREDVGQEHTFFDLSFRFTGGASLPAEPGKVSLLKSRFSRI